MGFLESIFGEQAIKKLAGSLTRHLMSGLGGLLLGWGLPEAAKAVGDVTPGVEQIIIAIAIYLFAQGWSLKQKKNQ